MKIGSMTIVLLSLLGFSTIWGQQQSADSLLKKIGQLQGVSKVDALNELADIYQFIDTKQAIYYAKEGLELAERINYQKGVAANMGSLGLCYMNLDNQKAVEYVKRSLEIRRSINDKPGIATSLNLLGILYFYNGDYLTSIDYHLRALKLREEIGDEVKIATSYNNIALNHLALENYEIALDYLKKALNIRMKTANDRGIGVIKDNIGGIYERMNQHELALRYFNEALEVNRRIGNRKSEANTLFDIAGVFKARKDYPKAFGYLKSALVIYKGLDEKNGIANTENRYAEIYQTFGKNDSAIAHASNAYENAKLIGSKVNISRSANILQDCYAAIGNYKKAYSYSKVYQQILNDQKSFEKIKKLAKIEYDYRLRKIKHEQETALASQKTYIRFLVVVLALSMIIIILIVVGYRIKRNANQRLNEFNRQLREANAAKDRFFSIIAHDLRGPFHSLLGSSEILASSADTLEKEEILKLGEGIYNSLTKQYGLLNDLLEWSKFQNGRFSLNPEKFNLKDSIDEVIEPLNHTIITKQLAFKNCVDSSIIVHADQKMIQLVMRNLVSNSIKFTPNGGCVNVSAAESGGNIEISVTDTGVGISREDMDKLFKIDVHHSTKGTGDESGTGFGLILCKEIIEKHSGTIKVESEPGRGSRFSFTIPKN